MACEETDSSPSENTKDTKDTKPEFLYRLDPLCPSSHVFN
jgi:hypothetical protein